MSRPTLAITLNTTWNLHNFRSGLIRAFVARGYRVVAIAPPDEYVAAVTALGADFIPLQQLARKGTNPLQDLRLVRELYRIYRREGVTVALHYTVKPVIYGTFAARLAGVRSVNTVTGLGYAFLSTGLVNRAVQQLYRLALRRADRTFLQNRDDYRLFLERGLAPAARTAIVPGSGIDTDRFAPRPGLAEPGYFLFIGRLLYDKGVAEFVAAARRVRARHPATSFHILGALDTGNPAAISRAELDDWVGEGLVHYHGTTEDTRPYLARAMAVVLPSYREGLPRVMLEGLAMAKPLITTDVPGCRETVVDGENGYLVEVKDAESLAAGMERMLALTPDQRRAMGAAGRRLAEARFAEGKIVAHYLSVVGELFSSAGRSHPD